ncbi:MAG: hypothetical protein RMX96_01725 [Nostoc sp. ChiSLP02]|nr:hypothetical protein [Nostoc sp. DedSLP05]MDZ8098818.1 hypothetical protein [Nostoc sp. DedSLP01]MDZ8183568.1 hypothetical protein [Nostoc sp. ChiSLP02]
MKLQTSLVATIFSLASIAISLPVKADTVNARCDVYPKGEDRATSSTPCTFSQRQGAIGIELQNGKRYDLRPVGNKPGNYQDRDGRPAYRQSGLGDRGQIYRLANESIYVYWDTAPFRQNSGRTNHRRSSTSSSHPDAGTSVSGLSDLVGARAGQAENSVKERGYRFFKSSPSADAVYSYWREANTNYCVTIRTEQGRYQSIAYATPLDCNK